MFWWFRYTSCIFVYPVKIASTFFGPPKIAIFAKSGCVALELEHRAVRLKLSWRGFGGTQGTGERVECGSGTSLFRYATLRPSFYGSMVQATHKHINCGDGGSSCFKKTHMLVIDSGVSWLLIHLNLQMNPNEVNWIQMNMNPNDWSCPYGGFLN